MAKFTCISDLHGKLPDISPTDFLLIAGDICPVYDHDINFQRQWMGGMFLPWLKKQPAKYKIFVFGNHDFVGEELDIDEMNRQFNHPMLTSPHNIFCLQDSLVEIEGYKIWGTPWQLEFYQWAFNLKEHQLGLKYNLIPADTDIIVSPGPPYGFGDMVPTRRPMDDRWPGSEHVGSPSLTEKIKEIQPKLVVYGHIHSSYGKYQLENSILVNASYVDESYKPKNKPIEVEL
jgi:Icc-related predicted phosphoesterase